MAQEEELLRAVHLLLNVISNHKTLSCSCNKNNYILILFSRKQAYYRFQRGLIEAILYSFPSWKTSIMCCLKGRGEKSAVTYFTQLTFSSLLLQSSVGVSQKPCSLLYFLCACVKKWTGLSFFLNMCCLLSKMSVLFSFFSFSLSLPRWRCPSEDLTVCPVCLEPLTLTKPFGPPLAPPHTWAPGGTERPWKYLEF